jgi:hypothetical protein
MLYMVSFFYIYIVTFNNALPYYLQTATVVLCAGNSKKWLVSRMDGDVQRRRSWTALEDLSNSGDKRKSDRQRRY